MSEAKVNSEDIEIVFQRLRTLPGNKTCFDCNSKNPTWSSITYGVFICLDCSAVHRSMGVHLTFVRSTQLDTNWTWLQMRQMQLGGNTNATSFFRQHNCISKDAQQKYNSRAAQLYRDKLLQNAKQAMKTYGTQLFLDQSHMHESVEVKPIDFFEQHTTNIDSCYENVLSDNVTSIISIKQDNGDMPHLREPKVLNDAEQKSVDHKTLLGGRQAHSKRSGLGGKKLGMGAQKVRANFADIEKEAELADKIKFSEPEKPVNVIVNDLHENQISSMRLAYQDLCIKKSKEEEKLKQVDPKKAAQLERLGMGFTSKNIVSHSALNDMTALDKEIKKQTIDHNEDKFYDCFDESKASEMLHIITMANRNRQNNSDDFFEFDDSMIRSFKSSFPPSKVEKIEKIDVITIDWNMKPAKKVNKEIENDSWESFENSSRKQGRNNRTKNIAPPPTETNEAFKKFGGAKSISSSQYFGDNKTSGEKSNLSRFEGSNSISSAELFGREEMIGSSSTYQPPDLDDVKESVKQGVTKVAGKLSSLANGMMSSFQEKYGGY